MQERHHQHDRSVERDDRGHECAERAHKPVEDESASACGNGESVRGPFGEAGTLDERREGERGAEEGEQRRDRRDRR